MSFTDKKTELLRREVEKRLGEKRFLHTLGVEAAAARLGEALCPDEICELRRAALLHDITKELSEEEQLSLLAEQGISDEDDISATAVHHSLTAPAVIARDFPDFATERVLSAVRRHTTGDEGMTVFDEIIFLADYIEDGRTYPACVELRLWLYRELDGAHSRKEALTALHTATLAAIDNTIKSIRARGGKLHPRTLSARDYIQKILGADKL